MVDRETPHLRAGVSGTFLLAALAVVIVVALVVLARPRLSAAMPQHPAEIGTAATRAPDVPPANAAISAPATPPPSPSPYTFGGQWNGGSPDVQPGEIGVSGQGDTSCGPDPCDDPSPTSP